MSTIEQEIVLLRHGDDGVKPTTAVRKFIEKRYADEGMVAEVNKIDRLRGRTPDGRYRYNVLFNLTEDA